MLWRRRWIPARSSAGSGKMSSWTGVIGRHRVRLTQTGDGIRAETAAPVADWRWLRDFLQTEVDLEAVLKTFPDDEPMRAAIAACRGLRVLRQEPVGMPGVVHFVLHQTNRPNPANRRAALRTIRRAACAAAIAFKRLLLLISNTGKNRVRDGSRTPRVQDGISRAAPARCRATDCRRQIRFGTDRAACRWPKRGRN